MLEPLVRGIPPIHSRRSPRRRRPVKLHADKGYDYDHRRRWLRKPGFRHRIAHKGIESPPRLGRHRCTIEQRRAAVAVAGAHGALRWGVLDALLSGAGVAVVLNLVADLAVPLLDPLLRWAR